MAVSFCAQLGEQIGKVFDCLASCGKAGTEGGAVGKQPGLLFAQADTHSNKLSSVSVIADLLIGCIGAYLVNVSLTLLFSLAGLLAVLLGLGSDVRNVLRVIGLCAIQAMRLDSQQDCQGSNGSEQVANHC